MVEREVEDKFRLLARVAVEPAPAIAARAL